MSVTRKAVSRLAWSLCGIVFMASDAAAESSFFYQLPAKWPFHLGIGLIAGAVIAAVVAYYLMNRPRSGAVKYGADEQKIFSATAQIAVSISIFAVLGILAIAITAVGTGDGLSKASFTFGVDILVSAAAGALGALFGFIFGIPRSPDPATRAAVATSGGTESRAVASSAALSANTNLERVSDWLTTLLIGATLVQLKEVPGWIVAVADYLGKGTFDNTKIIPFVAVYFFVLGFLGVYLITRLFLTTALLQMLSLLGGGQGVSETAVLRAKLSGALDAGPDELLAALGFYRSWPLRGEEKTDPELNADLARTLAKYLSTGQADDVTRRLDELKAAITNAARDPFEKDKLRKGFADKSVSTGDKARDDELVKLLA